MAEKTINVWDPLVRIFHWSLVAFFVVAYLTGEEDTDLHIYSGYAVLGLILFRVAWGFIGGKYARFSDFLRPPSEVFAYLKSLRSGQPQHSIGHNPAGGYMVIALLVMLLVTTVTGLKAYGVEGHGPLASGTSISMVSAAIADEDEHEEGASMGEGREEGEKFWEETHEVASNLTILLIVLHVLGVIMASRQHKENLVRAMITGKKSARSDDD